MKNTYPNISFPMKLVGGIESKELVVLVPCAIFCFMFGLNPVLSVVSGGALAYGINKIRSGKESGILEHILYCYLGFQLKGYLPPIKTVHRYTCFRSQKRQKKVFDEIRRPFHI